MVILLRKNDVAYETHVGRFTHDDGILCSSAKWSKDRLLGFLIEFV